MRNKKLYKAAYWVPEMTFGTLIPESDLAEYKAEIEEQRREFLEEAPGKADDNEAWAEWMDSYDWGVDEEHVQYDGDGHTAVKSY